MNENKKNRHSSLDIIPMEGSLEERAKALEELLAKAMAEKPGASLVTIGTALALGKEYGSDAALQVFEKLGVKAG